MPERLRFDDEDDNSAVEAAKTGYSAADSLNRAAESSAKRQQKRAVKREYAAKRYENMRREAECAEKAAETTSKTAKSAAEKLAEFLKEHKNGAAIVLAIVALLLIFTSLTSSCSVMLEGLLGSLGTTTYPSKPEDMVAVEAEYCRMESELHNKLDNYVQNHPGYDEYIIAGDVSGHAPYVLASILSAKHGEYTLSEVSGALESIFNMQYQLNENVVTETRYRTEIWTEYQEVYDPETEETYLVEYTYEEEVAHDYTICAVDLTCVPMETVADKILTDEQKQIYEILIKTKGNYPELFN